MPKKGKRKPPGFENDANASGGTKLKKISPEGSPMRKGGNTGGTSQAGNEMVQGASHQGSSLGKRNSG